MQSTPSSLNTRYVSQHGFTLIEMAIVIIIIGLVLGGIIEGRSILEAAETRSISTEADNYTSSIQQFLDKYGSLPGDMFDAETIWGQAAAGAACKSTSNNNKTTCNGDGNGQIALGVTNGVGGVETIEHLRAWQQLNNAGLIPAFMTGTPGSGGNDHAIPDTNVPKGSLEGSGYALYYQGVGAGSFFPSTLPYGNILHFGLSTPAGITDAPILEPQRAWEVDIKVDDGKPSSGTVRTYTNTAQPNCASADDDSATYLVTYADGRACNLIFVTGY